MISISTLFSKYTITAIYKKKKTDVLMNNKAQHQML